jgi:hypothetical protein
VGLLYHVGSYYGSHALLRDVCNEFDAWHGTCTKQNIASLESLGQTLPWAIVGGTGIYRNSRGDGTAQVPVDVPNQADANFVLNVVTG